MNKKSWAILVLAITFFFATSTSGLAYLIETEGGSSTFSWTLYRSDDTHFAYVAAEFTLSQLSTITSIEGWISSSVGGNLRITIYDDSNGNIPGNQVLFYQDFYLATGAEGWYGLAGLNVDLGAGTYWVAFEVPEVGFSGFMPYPWPHTALLNDAFYNENYSQWQPTVTDIGVRIDGSQVPLPGAA